MIKEIKKLKFESFIDMYNYFRTEKQCIEYFIKKRWNGKVKCPFKECKANEFNDENNKIYILASKKDFKCSCCKKIFSYKTGTVFENTKIPMKSWFIAIYLNISDKKGISSPQLARYLKVRVHTAWFMLQRIREIAGNFNSDDFSGITEMDETYIGGKGENRNNPIKKEKAKTSKTCVFGMANRDRKQVKSMKVESAEYHNLGKEVFNKVSAGSNIITDGHSSYKTLGKFYNHKSVNHEEKEFVRKDSKTSFKIHTNTIEGFWSLVKRTIFGTHHWISNKHINRYLAGIDLVYNTRNYKDTDRFNEFLTKTEKRLSYAKLIG